MATQIRTYMCDPFGKRFVELTSDNFDELKEERVLLPASPYVWCDRIDGRSCQCLHQVHVGRGG